MEIDHKAAGQKADATIVANLVRDNYSNPAKDAIRRWVTQELLTVQPTLVLDLWGGGQSADEMTAAGLSVLSVDDGRGFPEGIAAPRIKRALTIKAEAGGYRSAWGSVAKYAPECDAAWLDFMGHLCGETVRILRACRHMKALAITLMPDRMAGVQNLPIETWIAMYRGAIEHHTGMKVRRMTRKYKREGGLWVLVMLAMQDSRTQARRLRDKARASTPARLEAAREGRRRRLTLPENRERRRVQDLALKANPDYRAAVNASAAEGKRRRMADPEYRARERARDLATLQRRMEDPEYGARRAAHALAWRSNPERRAITNARQNQRRAEQMADPEYRAQALERDRTRARIWKSNPDNRAKAQQSDRLRYAAQRNP